MQRSLAQRISRKQKPSVPAVPQRDGVIADQLFDDGFSASLEAGEKDVRVAQLLRPARWNFEPGDQFVSVVEAKIREEHEPPPAAMQGLAIKVVLRKKAHQLAAKRNGAIRP